MPLAIRALEPSARLLLYPMPLATTNDNSERFTMIRLNTMPAVASNVGRHLSLGRPLVRSEGNPSAVYHTVKRAMDIVGAVALIVALSPVLLTVLVVLTISTRGKPFFFQRRAGHLGRPFMMAKFRTMRLDADKIKHTVQNESSGPIFKNRNDPRITRFGRFLRKTSIDEMPQLFHVLFGQMSLVGPRPLDVKEVARFEPWQLRRLAVKPGLTCLWQVSGRSDIGFEEWSRMDLWYVRNQSLMTDLDLLVRTPMKVLGCKGAY
jgi:lipopolysaccharide/colanic/teichoic acid biosynthesis glycosyltransferase